MTASGWLQTTAVHSGPGEPAASAAITGPSGAVRVSTPGSTEYGDLPRKGLDVEIGDEVHAAAGSQASRPLQLLEKAGQRVDGSKRTVTSMSVASSSSWTGAPTLAGTSLRA